MKTVWMVFLFITTPYIVHADDTSQTQSTIQSTLVGAGELVIPLALQDSQLSTTHAWEIEGFSYTATDLGYRFFPKSCKWMSPVVVGLLDLMFRSSELTPENKVNQGAVIRGMACDALGIIGAVTYHF